DRICDEQARFGHLFHRAGHHPEGHRSRCFLGTGCGRNRCNRKYQQHETELAFSHQNHGTLLATAYSVVLTPTSSTFRSPDGFARHHTPIHTFPNHADLPPSCKELTNGHGPDANSTSVARPGRPAGGPLGVSFEDVAAL